MRNPFISMALAAVAMQQAFKVRAIAAFNSGAFAVQDRPSSYAKKTGLTVAAVKRAAVKAKNRAKHRAAVAKSGARKNV